MTDLENASARSRPNQDTPQHASAQDECTCGAPTDGKWAGIHSANCQALADDLEGTALAVAVRNGVNLHPRIAREIVASLRARLVKEGD